ncbi:ORF1 in transposon ISC1212 [Saccharolobus solfataricus]|uniref:ORF1 in transposon ISC1212 n=1 Tax=Saccharolobus solfataricus TaxID=2287 RepID=A0A157T198_SACSO|nr:ORF1 in transposon ISC1212 [Saccharolobus solfataricus]
MSNINKKMGRDNIMVKAISTEKDLLLKADKVLPWEKFRNKLESLYLT